MDGSGCCGEGPEWSILNQKKKKFVSAESVCCVVLTETERLDNRMSSQRM